MIPARFRVNDSSRFRSGFFPALAGNPLFQWGNFRLRTPEITFFLPPPLIGGDGTSGMSASRLTGVSGVRAESRRRFSPMERYTMDRSAPTER